MRFAASFLRARFSFPLVLVLALGGAVPPAGAADTSLTMTSEPGDYVGNGRSYSYTPAQGTFSAQRNYEQGAEVVFNGSSAYWYLDFSGVNDAPLQIGLYPDATEFQYSGTGPKLRVSGSGGSCSGITGSFRVKQISYDTGDQVTSFWAVFEQRCGNATAFLRGEIRYNADVTVALSAPLSRVTVRLDTLTFPVTATGPGSGPITITAANLPEGATFDYDGERGGSFRWTPSARQIGRHRITFLATDDGGNADSTTTDIRVTGLTSLEISSEAGDYVGQGREYFYSDSIRFIVYSNDANGVMVGLQTNKYDGSW